MQKKRSATMQHSARTSFLSNCSKILLHEFKKGTAQIRGGTAQFVQFPRLKKAGRTCLGFRETFIQL